MPRISEVIADKAKYPDDAKFTLAGEEISFGELRRQNTESHGEIERQLNQRQSKLDETARMQEQATNTLAAVLENVSRVTGLSYEQLTTGNIPANLRTTVAAITQNTRTDAGVALKDDPLFKPILDYIEPMQNDLGTVKQALGVSIGAYKNTHTKVAYLDYMQSEDKPDGFKPKYEDALQLAVNKGFKDELGFPDVTRALREMAGPVAAKVDTDKVRQEGYDAGKKAAQVEWLAQLGQPQNGTGGISFDKAPEAGGKTKTIKEKLDEAFSDPSIAGGLFGNNSIQ